MGKKMPRSLQLAYMLLISIFLFLLVISTINVGISSIQQDKVHLDIEIVRLSNERNNYNNRIRVLLRKIINMSNGLEPLSSTLFPDRYKAYKDQLYLLIGKMKDTQNLMENTNFEYSAFFREVFSAPLLNVEYLSDNNKIVVEQHDLSFTMNLYMSRLLDIYNMNMFEIRGNTNVNTISPVKGEYNPTVNEKTIVFCSNNAIYCLMRYITLHR